MESLGNTKVVVVGQGYVGLPLAMRAVDAGFDVVGFEINRSRVENLSSGQSHVEDIGDDVLQQALTTGRYLATDDEAQLANFDFAVISVPTPLSDGEPDLSFIDTAGDMIAPHLRAGATVILESTTYPGTTEERLGPRLAKGSGLTQGTDFHLGYSPERIDPGNTVWTLATTPKVVSGIDGPSLERVQWFFDHIVECTVAVRGTREAELTKLLENTFRHVNIALVNELAMFANDLGIDVWDAIDAASTKPFGYMRFTPGPGVGGHCLPIDPSYLSWSVKRSLGHTFRFVELANDVNEHMPDYVVRRIIAALNDRGLAVRDRRIVVVGLAYKKNTGDARESPSTRICELLGELGAEVMAADSHVDPAQVPPSAKLIDLDEAVLVSSDVVVLLVDHDDTDMEQIAKFAPYVLDCRNRLSEGPNIERL